MHLYTLNLLIRGRDSLKSYVIKNIILWNLTLGSKFEYGYQSWSTTTVEAPYNQQMTLTKNK